MSKTIHHASVLLVLAVLLSGCSQKSADAVLQEEIATIQQMATTLETVTSPQTYATAEPQLKHLAAERGKLEAELLGMGSEVRDTTMRKHAAEYSQAMKRLSFAKRKAANVAFNAPMP